MREFRGKWLFLLFAVILTVPTFAQQTLREKLMARRRKRLERRGDLVTEEDYEGINTGEDFTKPFARTESRYIYQQVTGDTEASFLVFRQDIPYRFESGWIFAPRFEIPLIYTDIPSRDNPKGDYEFGFADVSTQFLFTRPTGSRWSFASGARFLWPTASQDQMGRGKYVAGPIVGATYSPKSWAMGGFVGLVVADVFDYAGKDNREDVHELSITPLMNYNFEALDDFWFVTLAPEIRINWKQDNDVFLPFKISIGKLLTDNSTFTVGFSAPIVNDYDLYDWQTELGWRYFF
ncbi:MAG: hypothetical protein ACYTBJ_17985 [Planctomycetota bacterium]